MYATAVKCVQRDEHVRRCAGTDGLFAQGGRVLAFSLVTIFRRGNGTSRRRRALVSAAILGRTERTERTYNV